MVGRCLPTLPTEIQTGLRTPAVLRTRHDYVIATIALEGLCNLRCNRCVVGSHICVLRCISGGHSASYHVQYDSDSIIPYLEDKYPEPKLGKPDDLPQV